MVGASRCFASNFSQLGGPDALEGVARFRCLLSFADFSFAHFRSLSTAKSFLLFFNLKATRNVVQRFTFIKGEEAARLFAAC
jgi:hypothetical protein